MSSLSWLTLRNLLNLPTSLEEIFDENYVDFEAFKRDWCQIRRQKFQWREIIAPCLDIMDNKTIIDNDR